MRCRRLILTAVALLSAIAHLGATDAPGKPRRIVSLNMCVDELVLRLAEPQNIASVTWLSRDPKNSNVAALAARIPVNHGLAEEIIPLNSGFDHRRHLHRTDGGRDVEACRHSGIGDWCCEEP